jgi:hypothetical protein
MAHVATLARCAGHIHFEKPGLEEQLLQMRCGGSEVVIVLAINDEGASVRRAIEPPRKASDQQRVSHGETMANQDAWRQTEGETAAARSMRHSAIGECGDSSRFCSTPGLKCVEELLV